MIFSKYFSEQARRPFGLFGKLVMSRIFDQGNYFLNSFMKDILSVKENDHILEIGFGTGKFIYDLAKSIKNGRIEGIDFSDSMVLMAKKRNRQFIKEGKVIITKGNFENISYKENTFDKVCSSNTIYFWPHPENFIKKISKILKSGGKVVVAFEDKKNLLKRPLNPEIFQSYGKEDIFNLFYRNGLFKDIQVFTKEKGSKIYHCAEATK